MSEIYVSTYRKYNEGILNGAWLTLENYRDMDEFYEACNELHDDEEQPELMFQDWEDIPDRYITGDCLHEDLWEWLALDADAREIAEIFFTEIDSHAKPQMAVEAYCGRYESKSDWAQCLWDETGMLDEVPEFARNFIDYQKYAREAHLGGDMCFIHRGGYVLAFRNC